MHKTIKRIIQAILFVLIIGAFIYIGTRDFSDKIEVDNEKFDHEYHNVDKDNVFKYANASQVYSILKGGSGIIFMGYPSNEWTGYYANILNAVAKELNIKEILYYDFSEDRSNANATYQSIVLRLTSYLPTLDDGTQNIYAPTLVIVKNGAIISYDNETAISLGNIKPEVYWNDLNIGLKKSNLRLMLNDYLNS